MTIKKLTFSIFLYSFKSLIDPFTNPAGYTGGDSSRRSFWSGSSGGGGGGGGSDGRG